VAWIATLKHAVRDGYAWTRQQLTVRGLIGVAVFLYCAPPDWEGRNEFWVHHWQAIRTIATQNGRTILIACSLVAMWLDHRHLVKQREPKSLNPHTLKGRTLKLRDEIQSFLDALGPKPEVTYTSDMDAKEYMRANWKVVAPWVDRLTYGYELRFSASVRKIYFEFGERSLLPGVGLDLPNGLASAEDVKRILEGLDAFAAKAED
jgi:hypothetical protein